jgi:hypothetical protein
MIRREERRAGALKIMRCAARPRTPARGDQLVLSGGSAAAFTLALAACGTHRGDGPDSFIVWAQRTMLNENIAFLVAAHPTRAPRSAAPHVDQMA